MLREEGNGNDMEKKQIHRYAHRHVHTHTHTHTHTRTCTYPNMATKMPDRFLESAVFYKEKRRKRKKYTN